MHLSLLYLIVIGVDNPLKALDREMLACRRAKQAKTLHWTSPSSCAAVGKSCGIVMKTPKPADTQLTPDSSRAPAVFEVAWLLLLFFLFAGSPPPDAGESCYLQKAKHFWDPTWCGRDLFLASADAHAVLYMATGWLTKYFSLETTAWICRVPIWLFMAYGWQKLQQAVVPGKFLALLSGGLFLVLSRWFPMAREVAVCGVESKAIAFGCVFFIVACMAHRRWNQAWIWVGIASGFHVVVGAWAAIITLGVWMASAEQRPPFAKMLGGILGGGLISLVGLVPALLLRRGADAATIAEADRVYVYERLRHHLVFHSFEHLAIGANPLIERFALLSLVCLVLAWATWGNVSLRFAQRFAFGALGISLVGILIDQSLVYRLDIAAPILRLYWYRMSDVCVPMAVSLSVVAGLQSLQSSRPAIASWGWIAAILVVLVGVLEVPAARQRRRIPDAILQPRPTEDSRKSPWFAAAPEKLSPVSAEMEAKSARKNVTVEEYFVQWKAMCYWVKEHSPRDALFLTPRTQQTFKWYAERAEVATWKDIPQDARSIVEWYQRLETIFPAEPPVQDLIDHSDKELIRLAHLYKAEFVVLDLSRRPRPVTLRRVYPEWGMEPGIFAVYRVPPKQGK